MKKLFLILISISLFSCSNASQSAEWLAGRDTTLIIQSPKPIDCKCELPAYHQAKLYCIYRFYPDLNSTPIDLNDLYQKIRHKACDSQTVSAKKLNDFLHRKTKAKCYDSTTPADCYIPHHAFVLTNQNGKPISIHIPCFTCNTTKIFPEKIGITCSDLFLREELTFVKEQTTLPYYDHPLCDEMYSEFAEGKLKEKRYQKELEVFKKWNID